MAKLLREYKARFFPLTLSVLTIYELFIDLHEDMSTSLLAGIVLGSNCLLVHSLLFVDVLLICGRADA
jgi:hypothetical protein